MRFAIEGRDVGDGVEAILGPGHREYEWAWTLNPEAVAQLRAALNPDVDVLDALVVRFSGEAAADLKGFLDAQGIVHTSWSRSGE